jgi:hypothetical protein
VTENKRFKKTTISLFFIKAYLVFNKNDFSKKTAKSEQDIEINFWARSSLVDEGFVDGPLELTKDIFNALLDIFSGVDKSALPKKIDVFAIPEYTVRINSLISFY